MLTHAFIPARYPSVRIHSHRKLQVKMNLVSTPPSYETLDLFGCCVKDTSSSFASSMSKMPHKSEGSVPFPSSV